MDLPFISFIAFATIAIVGSLMVVFKKNPVSAAFSLILVLFSFAGIYAVLGAHFVAALQILVYTGAIMVLFVFVIMLLNVDEIEDDRQQTTLLVKAITGLGVISLGTLFIQNLVRARDIQPTGLLTPEKMSAAGGNVQLISEALFTNYVFHFELLSFLVLAGIVATVALAKRNAKETENGVGK